MCVFQEKNKEKKVVPGKKEEDKSRKRLTITETSVSVVQLFIYNHWLVLQSYFI